MCLTVSRTAQVVELCDSPAFKEKAKGQGLENEVSAAKGTALRKLEAQKCTQFVDRANEQVQNIFEFVLLSTYQSWKFVTRN